MSDEATNAVDALTKPCARGCTWEAATEGEAARPRPATHGQLCASCFWRVKHALRMVPDLMANMRVRMVPAGVSKLDPDMVGVRSKTTGSPAPLNIAALDASDALFAKLVSWVDAFADELNVEAPSVRRWMGLREVQGSRPVSPVAAHDLASQLVHWFQVRLETIAATSSAVAFHDDIAWGWDESPGVYNLTGAYGVEPRPLRAADKRECPVCGRREVFVAWPDKLNPDVTILCGRCKWVAEPERYGHYAELFKSA